MYLSHLVNQWSYKGNGLGFAAKVSHIFQKAKPPPKSRLYDEIQSIGPSERGYVGVG